jgi:hypothetical protein
VGCGEPWVGHVQRMARKRPCRVCRHWFFPDPRVGDRQRVCSKHECQKARREQTQARWRKSNPDYFVARRIEERAAAIEQARSAEPPSSAEPAPVQMPRPLDRLPWDVAQDEFGPKGAEFIGCLGRLLVRRAQDERRSQVTGFT